MQNNDTFKPVFSKVFYLFLKFSLMPFLTDALKFIVFPIKLESG